MRIDDMITQDKIYYQILSTNSLIKCIERSVRRICIWILGLKGLSSIAVEDIDIEN